MDEGIGYKIGYGLGWATMSLLRFFYKAIVVSSSENIFIFFMYLCLVLSMCISHYIFNSFSVILIVTIIIAIILGINQYIKEYPEMKLQRQFQFMFEKLKFQASDESYPNYIKQERNEYCTVYHFYTLLPISEWRKKLEDIEMYLNAKIIDIIQDDNNNRLIYLIVQNTPLPAKFDWDDKYLATEDDCFSLGMGYYDLIMLDLNKYPHCFVAGTTGSGKSNILKCMIHQALMKEYEVAVVDFKRGVSFVEFSNYVEIYFEHDTTMLLLKRLVEETKQRLDLFRNTHVENIDDYRKNVNESLNRKIIFIDELAELLQVRDKELSHSLYDSLETLTRLARAVGIHLVMGMQRVDSTLISGQIKANVTGRLCGRFVDKEPSRIVLGNDMASTLPNLKGRFIFKDDTFIEVQCFYYQSKSNNYEEDYMNISQQTFEKVQEEPQEKADTGNQLSFDFSDID